MSFLKRTPIFYLALLLTMFVGLPLEAIHGQDKSGKSSGGFCNNYNYSNSDRAGFSEVREFSLPAEGSLNVDGGKNGGISVTGGTVNEIQVKACVNAWGNSEQDARNAVSGIQISRGSTIKAEGDGRSNWSVSYQITVPRNTSLNLSAKNGGIAIAGVEGELEFETVNGGVSLAEVAGNVRGRTTNGGVSVKLNGTSWNGSGLDVSTTNGGVSLSIPEGYNANIEAATVNGGLKSDFAGLSIDSSDRRRSKQINAPLNAGGAPIKVVTTNGGVKISSSAGTIF